MLCLLIKYTATQLHFQVTVLLECAQLCVTVLLEYSILIFNFGDFSYKNAPVSIALCSLLLLTHFAKHLGSKINRSL